MSDQTGAPKEPQTEAPKEPQTEEQAAGEPLSEGEGRDRRRFHRSTVLWRARLLYDGGEASCVVLNISANGAKAQTHGSYTGPEEVTLEIPRFGRFRAKVVWRGGNAIGMTFYDDPRKVSAKIGEAVPSARVDG